MRKNIYSLLFVLFTCVSAWAQSTVSGKVTDENGEALVGAIVRAEGTNAGATADENGAYSFEIGNAGSYTVVASSIGYAAKKGTVELDGSNAVTLDFTLASDAIGLSDVVVTGVLNAKSKMESSVSISTMNAQSIDATVARGTAEIFRSIPGIRSEASGGDGNTNITVRGVPISAGGAKYLQLQEDGLPILMFGDIAFATSDIFLRADNSVNRIEAIRGGSASTMATNSPAGIINFISNNGGVKGGMVGTTFGLDHNSFRTDFAMGTPLGDDMSFHVGGFFRQGEGVRTAGYNANNGAQIKANFTKRFNNGHVRIYYKYLNDRTAAYMPMPIAVSGTNDNPTWEAIKGFDPKRGTVHTPYLSQNLGLGGDGRLRNVDVADGMHPVSHAVGTEFVFDLGNGFSIEDRARLSFNSGRFVSPFPAEIATGTALANSVGTLLGDPSGDSYLQYTDGSAFQGGALALRIHIFDTELRNFNNMMNDFKLKKTFGVATVNLGFFKAQQNVQMSWLWNSYVQELNGDGARMLNVVDSSGNVLSENGLYAYGVPAWGNCCQRGYDAHYSLSAPYMGVEVALNESLNFDGSLRWDMGKVTGSYAGAVQSTTDINNDGTISAPEQSVSGIDNANSKPINYDYSYLSYSLGANYKINDNNAVFARYSRGGAAKADRILFTSNVFADGSAKGVVDYVNQAELGYKYKFSKGGIFATLFYAGTNEQGGFEATTQKVIENDYRAAGLELEAAINVSNFDFRGGLTYTNAWIIDTLVETFRPRRQSPFICNFTPSYTLKNKYVFGVSIIGTAKSFAGNDNKLVMPGYVLINPYISANVYKGLVIGVSANNILNSLGITESEETAITENATNYVRARSVLGRSITASVKYNF